MGDRRAAIDFHNKAMEAIADKGNPDNLRHAYSLFSSACYADPTWGNSFYQAGCNNTDLNLMQSAVACHRRAEQCELSDEDRVKVLTNLAYSLHVIGNERESMKWAEAAIKLGPDFPLAWVNLSVLHCTLGEMDKSVETAERGYKLLPDDARVEMALAFAYLFDGQYAKGLKHFESRFPYKLKNFLTYPYPKWMGEKDKTVFLVADQGLGDTISFARFVEAAAKRAKLIHACVQPECMRLFQHAFAHLDNVNLLPSPTPFPNADAWSTFVSLPYALGLSDNEIAKAPNIRVPLYGPPTNWKVPDRKLHIGIAWGGSPLNDIDIHRSIPVTKFLDLYRIPGIQLYSLQVGDRAKEMHDTGSAVVICDLQGYIRDVVDTMSIMRQLDLIICCESALGHIAGTIGKPCWIPYSWSGRDWRIGCRPSRPVLWNPAHRVFWQDESRTWDKPFREIEDKLRKMMEMKKAA